MLLEVVEFLRESVEENGEMLRRDLNGNSLDVVNFRKY